MAADRLHLDYETFSELDLPSVGGSRYSRDPSTEVLMAAWAWNDDPIQQWAIDEIDDLPKEIVQALSDPDVVKWAWNAPFEMNISENVLGVPIDVTQWRCTMALSLMCSLPGKLEKAGPVAGLAEENLKHATGKRLMNTFSKTRNPTKTKPWTRTMWFHELKKWEEYKAYNFQDVDTERRIYKRLRKFDPGPEEWDLWFIDQEINRAGIPINMGMVENAIAVYEESFARRVQEMRDITGLDNPMSTQQLLPWLHERGYMFEDCIKGHISTAREYLDDPPDYWSAEATEEYVNQSPEYGRVLDLRMETAKASPKKFHALGRAVDDDDNLRYAFQFAGASRTWRWAGRIYQPQNLPRPVKMLEKNLPMHAKNLERLDADSLELIYPNVMDLLSSCVRPAAQAPPGYTFAIADLNAIENRVLGWLADCDKILDVFRRGLDPYLSFGTYLFGLDYNTLLEEYKAGDGRKRTTSKPGVLGCGYMLGKGDVRVNRKTGEKEATGLLGYAWNMGITDFTPEQSALSVDTFRREFEEVTDYWYGIERAAKQCIRTKSVVEYGHVTFDYRQPFMRMILPSGRALHYCRPKIEDVMAPWGEMKKSITYEGLNDKKQWIRQSTHPGKLTENADQAIARDLLAHGMKLARKEGLDIRMHIHDEIVAMVPEDQADDALVLLRECMTDQPDWARGLPLGSAGFTSEVFIKD